MNTATAKEGARPSIRTISITLDAAGKPFVAQGDLDVTISPANNEEIAWVSAEPFLVDFKGNSPFYEKQFSDKYAQSGLVRRDVLGSPNVFYEYSIIVNGEILDPRFGVDP